MAEEAKSEAPLGRVDTFRNAENAFLKMDDAAPAEEPTEETPVEEEQAEQEASSEVESDQPENVEVEAEPEPEILPQDQTYKVRANGQDVEVTLDELISSYSRQSDYTQKTQAIAEEKKILQERLAAVGDLEQRLAEMRDHTEKLSQVSDDPGEDYWNQLKVENPMQYMIERDEFRERQAEKNRLLNETMEMQKQVHYQKQLEAEQSLKEENEKLLKMNPKWADPDVFSGAKSRMRSAGKLVGFSDEELQQVTDHRAVMILHKASLWDELQKNRSKIRPAPVRTSKQTGRPLGTQSRSALTKAKQKLAKSGKPADAQNAFEQLLMKG